MPGVLNCPVEFSSVNLKRLRYLPYAVDDGTRSIQKLFANRHSKQAQGWIGADRQCLISPNWINGRNKNLDKRTLPVVWGINTILILKAAQCCREKTPPPSQPYSGLIVRKAIATAHSFQNIVEEFNVGITYIGQKKSLYCYPE